MKKIFTLLLLFVLCMTMGVYAKDINLDFLDDAALNSSYAGNMTITIDKPLEVITVLEKGGYLDIINKFIDLRALLEGLADSEITLNCKINANKDLTKMRTAVEYDVSMPTVINPNLKMHINARNGIWMDYDLTGAEPKLDMIMRYPIFNKYLHTTEQDSMGESMIESFMWLYGGEQSFLDTAKELMIKYADIAVSGNTYTVKLDNASVCLMLKDYFEYISENMKKNTKQIIADYPEDSDDDYAFEDYSPYDDIIPEIESFFDKYSVIGKEGITTKYVKGLGGKLKSEESIIPIDINLYRLLEATGEEIPAGLTEENSSIAFTIKTTADYTNVGTTKKIDFPTLTEDNSFTFDDLNSFGYDDYDGYYDDYKRTDFDGWINVQSDSVIKDGDVIYVPFRETIENACSYELYDEGDEDNPYYTINYVDGWVSFNSRLADFGVLEFKVGRNDCYYKDGTYNFGAPKLINDRVWVDAKLFEDVFGWEIENMAWDYITNILNVNYSNYHY